MLTTVVLLCGCVCCIQPLFVFLAGGLAFAAMQLLFVFVAGVLEFAALQLLFVFLGRAVKNSYLCF